MEYREYRNTEGTQRTVENGREQRVQCSTWSTESTGTLRGHRGQWRTVENREYSVVHEVWRVQEHRGNTEDYRARARLQHSIAHKSSKFIGVKVHIGNLSVMATGSGMLWPDE